MLKINLSGEFTDLNTYINAERRNRFLASKIKKEETERVYYLTKGKKLPTDVEFPLIIELMWYVKDLRKDADNISFAKKFIADGMVLSGLLPEDSRKYVRVWRDMDIIVDKENPRVEIVIHSFVSQAIDK